MLPQVAAALLKFRCGAAHAIVTMTVRVSATLLDWQERHRQRRSLGKLSSHMLRDIGLTSRDADREAGKRFWQE